MPPAPDPGPVPSGPSLRAPIAATAVLVSLWAVFTLGAWQLAGPVGAVADDVESRLGLDANPGKAKDEAKDSDVPAKAKESPPKKPKLTVHPAKEEE